MSESDWIERLPRPDWTDGHGRAALYLGDCRELLPRIPRDAVDLIATDPPYGIDHRGNGQWFKGASPIAGDDSTKAARFAIAEAKRRAASIVCFFSPFKPIEGFRNVLCWNKGDGVGIGGDRETCWKRDFELIGVTQNGPLAGARDSSVLQFASLPHKLTGHFAEKPVALMRYLIGKIDASTVCDPFTGTAATGIAAIQLGRRFVGIEIEKRWCDVAVQRVREAIEQFGLFEPAVRREPHPELFTQPDTS